MCSAGVVRCTGNCELATELKAEGGLYNGYIAGAVAKTPGFSEMQQTKRYL